jgi:excisionase family DNA binding protein
MAIDTGFVTVSEAAARLSLSPEQIRRRLRSGKLRGRREGHQWLVEEALLSKLSKRPPNPLLSDEFIASVDKLRAEIAEYNRAQGHPPFDALEMIRRHRDEV